MISDIKSRVFLTRYPITLDSSWYINAVHVDGFQSPNKFIVTEQPLPSTLKDFWRLIDERKPSVIVSLNEIDPKDKVSIPIKLAKKLIVVLQTCCQLWPTNSREDFEVTDYLTISCANTGTGRVHDTHSDRSYDIHTVHLLNTKDKVR